MAQQLQPDAKHTLPTTPAPLHHAAESGDADAVVELLESGVSVHARTHHPDYTRGATALHLAARMGHLAIALALLSAGARPDGHSPDELIDEQECEGDLTPLHEACARGHVAVVAALLRADDRTDRIACGRKAGPGVSNRRSSRALSGERDGGHTPLHLASAFGHASVVRELVDAGASLDTRGGDCDDTPLHLAASAGQIGAMEALIDAGADVNAGDDIGNTPLHVAADVDSMEFLLAAGADPNLAVKSPYGSGTPLGGYCTLIHRLETSQERMQMASAQVEVLLRHGADTGRRVSGDVPWSTPPVLSCAAKNGVPGIVGALVRVGEDPNRKDNRGWSPLHDAAQGDHVEVVRVLLRAGASVDATTDRERWTALHVACRYTSLACVLELLGWGADLTARPAIARCDNDRAKSATVHEALRGSGSAARSTCCCCCCDATPAEVVGLRNRPVERQRTGRGLSILSQSEEDEDEQMEVLDENTGEKDTSVNARNAVRKALRREAAWRRRRNIICLKTIVEKQRSRCSLPGDARSAGLSLGLWIYAGSASDTAEGEEVTTDAAPAACEERIVVRRTRAVKSTGNAAAKKLRRSIGAHAAAAGALRSATGGAGLREVLARVIDLAGCEEALFRHVVMLL